MPSKKKIFVIAGEASGDTIGANLIRELQSQDYIIKGIGGQAMEESGCEIIFHYDNIAVMGLVEVVFSLPNLMQSMNEAIKSIVEFQPDLIVTIDSPGFNFRLIRKLRKLLKFTAIHYVAPTVWAYGASRVKVVEELFDHILLILPFEGEYFSQMPYTFVGHPIVEDNCKLQSAREEIVAQDNLKLQSNLWHIAIMVGSRRSEIRSHTRTIVEWINLMEKSYDKDMKFHFLTLPHLESFLRAEIAACHSNSSNIYINSDSETHSDVIGKSILGLVKSGTATMRFMANGTPAITFYKVSKITAWIMKRRLKINKFNLCNIITNSYTLPELIQEDFTTNKLMARSKELLESSRLDIINCYLTTWDMLQQEVLPSKKAAEIVKKYLEDEGNNN
jgi:lipid-A-disaccharide synthase